jgi:hypothetical protein
MSQLQLQNLLPENFPQRDRIEAAVRRAFDAFDGGPWSLKLSCSNVPDRVAIDLVQPQGGVSFTSVDVNEGEPQITEQLRLLIQPPHCAPS